MNQFIIVLGTAQDGGIPQTGCYRSCCKNIWKDRSRQRYVSSLAIVDTQTSDRWLVDATPDFKYQLNRLDEIFPTRNKAPGLTGIFLTHGHIGHYTGLINLENAALNSKNVPVYVMPKMRNFLSNNRPWQDLIRLKNIKTCSLQNGKETALNKKIFIKPFLVHHRAEFSETVGFRTKGPNKTILYIPDIDKWQTMNQEIENEITKVDFAFLDGTFFSAKELPYRDVSQVPHPFIFDTITRLRRLPAVERKKVFFTHLHHTNPVLNPFSDEFKYVVKNGFRVAEEQQIIGI